MNSVPNESLIDKSTSGVLLVINVINAVIDASGKVLLIAAIDAQPVFDRTAGTALTDGTGTWGSPMSNECGRLVVRQPIGQLSSGLVERSLGHCGLLPTADLGNIGPPCLVGRRQDRVQRRIGWLL